MKKILLSLTIIVCLNACKESSDNVSKIKTKHYESTLHHVAFDYPANWDLSFIPDSSNPHAIIALKNPIQSTEDSYAEELNIWWEALPITISDSLFHKANIAQIKIINDSIEVVNEGLKTIGKNNFYEYKMDFSPDAGKNYYHVNGYSLVKDSVGYSINFTAEKNKAGQFQSELDIILKSFKPL